MNAFPTTIQLPPGCRVIDGIVYRRVTKTEDGQERFVRRPVALSLDEARKTNADYYHPKLGWIRGGKKMEREHPLVEQAIIDAETADDWPDAWPEDGEPVVVDVSEVRPAEPASAFHSFLPPQPAPSYDAGEF